MTKSISLTQGKIALVDDEDYEKVNQYKWYPHKAHKGFYASRCSSKKTILMHRFVLGAEDSVQVDHINGDKLDNRKTNLRLCNNSQNHANGGVRSDNTSGYVGITWDDKRHKWRAQITYLCKGYNLGRYATPEEAAKVYDEAAKKYFGEFARTNFK